MKKCNFLAGLLAAIFCLCSQICEAQLTRADVLGADLSTLPRVQAGSLPTFGTYFSLQKDWPPCPCYWLEGRDDLPIYLWGYQLSGRPLLIVDDRSVDYDAEPQMMLVLGLAAHAAGLHEGFGRLAGELEAQAEPAGGPELIRNSECSTATYAASLTNTITFSIRACLTNRSAYFQSDRQSPLRAKRLAEKFL